MNPQPKHHHLVQFLSGYFHEDWGLDADGPAEVVADFLRRVGPSESFKIADEIDDVLKGQPSEDTMSQDLFERFGCYYDPRPDWGSSASWLRAVARQLRGRSP